MIAVILSWTFSVSEYSNYLNQYNVLLLFFVCKSSSKFRTSFLHTASLVTQIVKNPPAMQETWVRFLGWEDPLEEARQPLWYSRLENLHGQRSLQRVRYDSD